MAYHLNRIFSAGIVWDPSEPLPPELQDQDEALDNFGFPSGRRPKGPSRKLNNFAAHVDSISKSLIAKSVTVPPAATWPLNVALPTFAKQEHGRNVLPPRSVTANASIVQDTARVAVTQHFYNDSTAPIKEAAFTFPLPTGCTITDFSFRIGTNKIITGTVKPRQDAREAFERHIRHHDTAAGLLEQDTPEIFTTSLGNIPEKTRVEVSLNYITLLKHRFADSRNVTTLTLPTCIAPRYGDAPEDYNNAAGDVPQGLTLEVEIVESERITSIASPSHAVSVERRPGARIAETFADLAGEDGRSQVESASVKLQSDCMFLDKDFVLDIMTTPLDGETETPQAWLETHPTMPNQKALMLTLPSGYLNKQASQTQRSEILFLADRSGSMDDKIASLKSAMQFFLKGIPEGRKFNIWSFGSEFTSWQPHSVDYGEATLKSALNYVDRKFAADMGGTELLPAIKAIISARDKSLITDVIVLTDGQTWRMDQTLEYIQKIRRQTEGRVRFFALGIGKAVSHALVDGIAKAGGGYAEVVQEASQGGWEDRVVSMAKAALMSSHLGPLHIEFKMQDGDGNTRVSSLPDAQRSPADVSVVSPFDRSRIYFLFDTVSPVKGLKEVKVDILANGETKSLSIPIVPLEKPDTTIHKLAARSMLEDLERGRSHIHLGSNRPVPGSWDETNKVHKEAEKIACKWGLVSKWTSLFLIDEPPADKPDAAPAEGVVEVKDAPGEDLLEPRGATQPSALPGTANVLTGGLHSAVAQSAPGNDLSDYGGCLSGTIDYSAAVRPMGYSGLAAGAPPLRSRVSNGRYEVGAVSAFQDGSNYMGPYSSKTWDPVQAIKNISSYTASSEASWGGKKKGRPTRIRDTGLDSATLLGAERAREHESRSDGFTERDTSRSHDRPWMDELQPFPGSPPPPRSGPPRNSVGDRDTEVNSAPLTQHAAQGSSPDSSERTGYLDVRASEGAMPFSAVSSLQSVAWSAEFAEETPDPSGVGGSSARDSGMAGITGNRLRSLGARFSSRARSVVGTFKPQPSQAEVSTGIFETGAGRDDFQGAKVKSAPPAQHTAPESLAERGALGSPHADAPAPATYSTSVYELSSTTDDYAPKKSSERDLIYSLVQFQQHDGSIDFGPQDAIAEKLLGKEVWDAIRLAQKNEPGLDQKVLLTAAVLVLLERDLQSCKSLWELMALKMETYCRENTLPGGSDVLDLTRKHLDGVKLPIHQKDRASAGLESAPEGFPEIKGPRAVRVNWKDLIAYPAQEDNSQDSTDDEHSVVDGERKEPEKQQQPGPRQTPPRLKKVRPKKLRRVKFLDYFTGRRIGDSKTPPVEASSSHPDDPVKVSWGGDATPIPKPELAIEPPKRPPSVYRGSPVVVWDGATPSPPEPALAPAPRVVVVPTRKRAPAPEPVPVPPAPRIVLVPGPGVAPEPEIAGEPRDRYPSVYRSPAVVSWGGGATPSPPDPALASARYSPPARSSDSARSSAYAPEPARARSSASAPSSAPARSSWSGAEPVPELELAVEASSTAGPHWSKFHP